MHNVPALREELRQGKLGTLHRMQDQAVRSAAAAVLPPFDGAGIVMVAGGGRCFTNAWVALTFLREVVRTQLPIEVWYLGDWEFSDRMKELLRRFDVRLVNASFVRRQFPMRQLGGWECKAYAIRHSRFRHVILLDADNVPLIDPAELLDCPEYSSTGAIFWSDNHSHPRDSAVWDLFRAPYRQELEVESGQLVIDKERCWVPLHLALHFNDWSDIYYQYVYGDKETFHFAWRQLGQPYSMPDGRPDIVYCRKETPHGPKRMTAALEHRDFDGRTVFHHRTGAEWLLFGENASTVRTDIEALGLAAVARLRELWDGHVVQAPAPGSECATQVGFPPGDCLLRRPGFDERVIQLEPGGRIGTGATAAEHAWRHGDASNTIALAGKDGDTCRLSLDHDGVWRGRELWFGRLPVELVPLR